MTSSFKKNGKRNRYLTICKELCGYTGQNKAADHYTASLKETAQMMGELAYRHSASASKCLECLWSMMTRSWCFSKKHSRADSGVRAMLHLKLAFSHAQQKPLLWLSSLAKTKSTWSGSLNNFIGPNCTSVNVVLQLGGFRGSPEAGFPWCWVVLVCWGEWESSDSFPLW